MSESVDLTTFDKVFLGKCFAIALTKRKNEAALFTILTEDDGDWFVCTDTSADVSWLGELSQLIAEAQKFLSQHKKAYLK